VGRRGAGSGRRMCGVPAPCSLAVAACVRRWRGGSIACGVARRATSASPSEKKGKAGVVRDGRGGRRCGRGMDIANRTSRARHGITRVVARAARKAADVAASTTMVLPSPLRTSAVCHSTWRWHDQSLTLTTTSPPHCCLCRPQSVRRYSDTFLSRQRGAKTINLENDVLVAARWVGVFPARCRGIASAAGLRYACGGRGGGRMATRGDGKRRKYQSGVERWMRLRADKPYLHRYACLMEWHGILHATHASAGLSRWFAHAPAASAPAHWALPHASSYDAGGKNSKRRMAA